MVVAGNGQYFGLERVGTMCEKSALFIKASSVFAADLLKLID